jgi:hypothetical protein
MALVTLLLPMAVTPPEEIVTSPVTALVRHCSVTLAQPECRLKRIV